MLKFNKYHGLGNDFLVIEASDFLAGDQEHVGLICDRHEGVGADGVLLVGEGPRMTVYNADGSRPQMCGNGVRCVARYLSEKHGWTGDVTIQTDAGPRLCRISHQGSTFLVDVDMGSERLGDALTLDVEGVHLDLVSTVSMGNPHAVYFGALDATSIDKIGSALNADHPSFPEGVNFEVVQVLEETLEVVVFERGVGRTRACGTGACAVGVAAWERGIRGDGPISVTLPGGELIIERRNGTVWMRGPAEFVYYGEYSRPWREQQGR